ncbi:hypothetical protein ACV22V_19475 [Burkholderia sp. AW33-5]
MQMSNDIVSAVSGRFSAWLIRLGWGALFASGGVCGSVIGVWLALGRMLRWP